MEKKKPRNRETYTTNIKGSVKRRGSGLGTGPVGNKKEKKKNGKTAGT
jgi:hypothetical protein